MKKEIWFDMDGTIANFYGVEGWLECIKREQTKPYREAKPLIDMKHLAKELNRLQKLGYTIGIISWLAKGSTENYDKKVKKAKKNWLKSHLKSVKFDKINIVKYGTPKENFGKGILFDDEELNRKNWKEKAFDEKNIIEILRAIA
jgi:hypothetical protein